ncbi:ABC transporter C family member 10 [Hordeum vulgare]|nr:ABC transporter C family member 10 [Hordeum vulgare]
MEARNKIREKGGVGGDLGRSSPELYPEVNTLHHSSLLSSSLPIDDHSNHNRMGSLTALKQMFNSSTCTNHLAATGGVVLLGLVLALQLLVKIPQSRGSAQQLVTLGSPLHLSALVFGGTLGLVYLGLGLWMLGSNFSQDASTVYLPHWWLVTLS